MRPATSRRTLWLQKIADQVAHTLSDRIAGGDLKPGASPGTREALAAEFVTSTSVIDRALEQMTDKGVLTQRADGSHVVAQAPAREHGFELPAHETLADVVSILEMRLGLESVGAGFAAERHDAAHLGAIRAAADAYEAAATQGEGAGQADFRFHRSIAEASGNPYLLDLLDYLGPLLIPRMRVSLPGKRGDAAAARHAIDEHRAIVRAIEAREPDTARGAMRNHLSRTLEMVKRV
ncbi:MAG: FadR family transcriptional regulator [Rhodobacteraceae bacterium]|nr:MAG: FadR family transcriptional regulator [Paracoccaceae bacterium]